MAPKRKRPEAEVDEQRLVNLYFLHGSLAEVARLANVSTDRVRRAVASARKPIRRGPARQRGLNHKYRQRGELSRLYLEV